MGRGSRQRTDAAAAMASADVLRLRRPHSRGQRPSWLDAATRSAVVAVADGGPDALPAWSADEVERQVGEHLGLWRDWVEHASAEQLRDLGGTDRIIRRVADQVLPHAAAEVQRRMDQTGLATNAEYIPSASGHTNGQWLENVQEDWERLIGQYLARRRPLQPGSEGGVTVGAMVLDTLQDAAGSEIGRELARRAFLTPEAALRTTLDEDYLRVRDSYLRRARIGNPVTRTLDADRLLADSLDFEFWQDFYGRALHGAQPAGAALADLLDQRVNRP